MKAFGSGEPEEGVGGLCLSHWCFGLREPSL